MVRAIKYTCIYNANNTCTSVCTWMRKTVFLAPTKNRAGKQYMGLQHICCRGLSPLPLWGATLRQKIAPQNSLVEN